MVTINLTDSRILLVSDDEATAKLVYTALGAAPGTRPSNVHWVHQLAAGIACLGQKDFAFVLLDLSLLDGNAVETFKELFNASAEIPILILGKDDQEANALRAVEHGAKDYVLRSHLDSYSLPRALRNVTDRILVEDTLLRVSKAIAVKGSHALPHDVSSSPSSRTLFNEGATRSIALARLQATPLAVMFLKLTNFKYLNDRFGEEIGDQVLQSVSKQLTKSLRASDSVCRNSRDEFLILLALMSCPTDPAISAERLLRTLDAIQPAVDRPDLHIRASIGISVYPNDGEDVDILIQKAEAAMQKCKINGYNAFQYFRAE